MKDQLVEVLENQRRLINCMNFISDGFMANQVTLEDTLPFETNAEIFNFMKKDVEYYRRKTALRQVMRTANQKNVTTFIGSLCNTLFDDDYRATHRWPSNM